MRSGLALAILLAATVAAQPQQLRVVENPPPVYPTLARQARVVGTVRMSVTVGADGRVKDVRVVSGNPLLNQAAIDAVKQWRYEPRFGEAVTEVTMTFALPAGVVSGRILDTEGNPIAGVTVSMLEARYWYGRKTLSSPKLAGVKTNELGAYRVTGLDYGEYYVLAEYTPNAAAPQSSNSLARQTFYPGVLDPAVAALVTVVEGWEGVANFGIQPTKNFRVTGKVVITGGPILPTGTGRLELTPRDSTLFSPPVVQTFDVGKDVRSEFPISIPSIRPGVYDLFATVQEGGPAPPVVVHQARGEIRITDENLEGIELVARNLSVTGRIAPAPGVTSVPLLPVRLRRRDYLPSIGQAFNGVVDANGAFKIDNAIEGEYVLSLAPPLPPTPSTPQPQPGQAPTDFFISDIRQGDSSVYATGKVTINPLGTEPITVVMSSGAGTIDGTVLDKAEQGVQAGVVALVPDFRRRDHYALYQRVTSDASGRFRIAGISPGDYTLLAWKPAPPGEAEMNADFLRQYETRGVRVTVRSGEPPQTVRVTVIPETR